MSLSTQMVPDRTDTRTFTLGPADGAASMVAANGGALGGRITPPSSVVCTPVNLLAPPTVKAASPRKLAARSRDLEVGLRSAACWRAALKERAYGGTLVTLAFANHGFVEFWYNLKVP